MAKIVFNPAAGTELISLDDIPEDVKQDVEDMFQATYFDGDTRRDSPRPGTWRVTDDSDEPTKQKAAIWLRQAKAYGAQRDQLKDAEGNALEPVVVRKSPTSLKSREAYEMDVSVRTEDDAKKDAAKEESAANQK